MTDFEPYIEKFVELDLARFVTNEMLYNKKILLFLFEKGNLNLLKPIVQASKDKNYQDPNNSEKEKLLQCNDEVQATQDLNDLGNL